jgi:indole-3-glycerol phosphate synthase
MSKFATALENAAVPVIGEVKLRSSAGVALLGDRSVEDVLDAYADNGIGCVSVVTGRWFGGTADLLPRVTAHTALPVLQKDFLTRRAQLRTAAEHGASSVLLTAGLLPADVLNRLADMALEVGLTPFVEVVDVQELAALRNPGECVVAVNNKDIATRERDAGDLDRSVRMLAALRAAGVRCAVSASGITTPADGARLVAAGYDGLLVGTGLLSAASPGAWLAELRDCLR